MGIRTDLAFEKTNFKNSNDFFEEKQDNFLLNFAKIDDKNYATIYFDNIEKITDFSPLENYFLKSMRMLEPNPENLLVVGLGNPEITADSIGPKICEKILATRHITGNFAEKIGLENLKNVAVIAPNVLGKTGIEVQEILSGIIEKTKVKTVVVIDALCAKNKNRIFRTIQLTDSGIAPGSGVKNKRREISQNTLGVKVIAIGVPTVIQYPNDCENLIVTPKECDLLVTKISDIISRFLNLYLQPEIDREILLSLV